MEFTQYAPSVPLRGYVDFFYLFESDTDSEISDVVFPSGAMEMIFNLGPGIWESTHAGKFNRTPRVELWGQVTEPMAIRSKGRHVMLGVRFFAHTAAYFLNDEIGAFNNNVFDLADVLGKEVMSLHARLLETREIADRISLVENFLMAQLNGVAKKKTTPAERMTNILRNVKRASSADTLRVVASSFGITPRYLHKLTYQYTGLSPKSLVKINRFQLSLKLLSKNNLQLTAIALDCGYFDQSHFIRDFKNFTGFTPSGYLKNTLPINEAVSR